MPFILNSHNVLDYLVDKELSISFQQPLSNIESIPGKNFNLLLTFADNNKFLLKQERYNQEGKAAGEFLIEWRIQEFLQKFSMLSHYREFLPDFIHFDKDNSLLIFKYLDDYQDLMKFYSREKKFPTEISTIIGTILGTIHKDTFNHQEYQDFFLRDSIDFNQILNLIKSLERVEPEIFGLVPSDGLKFFALYQKYDSLGKAISELGNALVPSCLTHNDLKLNNILLQKNWQNSSPNLIRLIDWERSGWGDPAFDLGTLIGNYIQLWLSSLVISNSLSIEESLRLAITPLEVLQPSIATLVKAYLITFPELLQHRPDFLQRVVQFSGFALIQQIQSMIQYQRYFGNVGIAMLQVAKTLLCRPVQSIPTVFGDADFELNLFNSSAV